MTSLKNDNDESVINGLFNTEQVKQHGMMRLM